MCLALFLALPLEGAAIWSLLGAYLLLPSNLQIDLPMLPPIDKMSIAAVTTFLLCWMKGTPSQSARPSFLIYLLCLGFVISPMLTSLDNSYELQTAAGSIPGFYPLDGIKIAGRHLFQLLPLFIGMRFLSTDYARSVLLKSLPAALAIYSLPMLFEIRMSPQLHYWVYGYYPSEFQQMMRAGGFRPVVFLQHGLELALLTSLALLSTVVVARAKWRVFRAPAGAIAAYLGGVLILCKSLGPVIYATVLTPVVLWTRPRIWTRIACAILILVCAYPVLRNHGLVPAQIISKAAGGISEARSDSLNTRLLNEDQLMSKANEKPLFGWGTFGRNRIYDRNTGRDLSVTDGGWIIQFGTFGWFGYLSLFGLLGAAVFRAHRALDDKSTVHAIELGGLTLLLGVYALDQLPNANSMSLIFLLAGSIAASLRSRVHRRTVRTTPGPDAEETVPAGAITAR